MLKCCFIVCKLPTSWWFEIVLCFLHSTSVLPFYVDVALALSLDSSYARDAFAVIWMKYVCIAAFTKLMYHIHIRPRTHCSGYVYVTMFRPGMIFPFSIVQIPVPMCATIPILPVVLDIGWLNWVIGNSTLGGTAIHTDSVPPWQTQFQCLSVRQYVVLCAFVHTLSIPKWLSHILICYLNVNNCDECPRN